MSRAVVKPIWWVRLVWLSLPVLWLLPGVAGAHPLGNFTTNQYLGIHLTPDTVVIDHVVDMAEIPASQLRREIDIDGDDTIGRSETDAYTERACRQLAEGIRLSVNDRIIPLIGAPVALTFPGGQAGLPTLRLECRLTGSIDLTGPATLAFENTNFAHRLGWREVVATSKDVALETDLPSASMTERLTAYPEDRLTSPVEVRAGMIELSPAVGVSVGTTSAVAVLPPSEPGISAPVDALASLIDPARTGAGAVGLALVAALGLGVVHALAPGHGKTIMAAYLVGTSGRFRHALGLGLAVAISHTVGVLALGVVALAASSAFSPERVFPVLSTISGVLIIGVGVWMVARGRLPMAGHDHGHDHDHDHDHQSGPPGWRLLATLGLSGGLVPSASAVVLLLAAINLGRIPVGLGLIAMFGIGMALALVAVGFGLQAAGRFGLERLPDHRIARRIRRLVTPVASVIVIGIGIFLTARAVGVWPPG